ncbi:MAG: ParB/Srx family N-terminal domain-containing protein [Sphaerospermopsis kisseleviana]
MTKPGWTTNKNQLNVVWRSLSDIIMYAKNSKLHPPEQVQQIAKSIVEFGFLDPIAVDENGEILEGHGRYLAAESLQLKLVPTVQILGLTQEQKVAYRIAHNKLTMNSDFDLELLKLDIDFLSEMDFDLGLTGFDSEDLSGYLSLETTEYQEQERQNNVNRNNPVKQTEPDNQYLSEIKNSSAKEINVDEFEFDCKCPKCGFEFNQ